MTTLASLYVPARARLELRWFYKQAAAELGFRSNFEMMQSATALVAHHDPGDAEKAFPGSTLERISTRVSMERWQEEQLLDDLRAESRHRLRCVWIALAGLTAGCRRAIEALYVDRQWPNALSTRFGEVNDLARDVSSGKRRGVVGDARESVLGLLVLSAVARKAFVAEVTSKRPSDGLVPVTEGTHTADGCTVSPHGRRIAVRHVAILEWLDDVCRHRESEKRAMLAAIDAECKAMSIGAHRAYAEARGILVPAGAAA